MWQTGFKNLNSYCMFKQNISLEIFKGCLFAPFFCRNASSLTFDRLLTTLLQGNRCSMFNQWESEQ